MVKLLIADDEALERKVIKKVVNDAFPDRFSEIREADNGREAVASVKEAPPDLIFMDIKMPLMSGIDAVKRIKKDYPHIKIIMLTAFDTFEYAKQLMREGVREYLLKPCRKEEMIEAAARSLSELENEALKSAEYDQLERDHEKAVELQKTEWVASLLFGQSGVFDPSEAIRESLQRARGFQVVLFDIEKSTAERSKVCNSLYSKLKESYECTAGPLVGRRFPVVFFHTSRDQPIELKQMIMDFPVTAGAGRVISEPEQLAVSYQEAQTALKNANIRKRLVMFTEAMRSPSPERISVFKSEQHVIAALTEGDMRKAAAAFENLTHELLLKYHHDGHLVAETLTDIFNHIQDAFKLDLSENAELLSFKDQELAERVRLQALARFAELAEKVTNWKAGSKDHLLNKIKEWIETSYQTDISLETAAEKAGMSAHYLSKIFKEQFGFSFVDYLTQCRIGAAKQKLSMTDLPLKEISYTVGYSNPNYFSRVFKKATGMTPKQYRAAHNQVMIQK